MERCILFLLNAGKIKLTVFHMSSCFSSTEECKLLFGWPKNVVVQTLVRFREWFDKTDPIFFFHPVQANRVKGKATYCLISVLHIRKFQSENLQQSVCQRCSYWCWQCIKPHRAYCMKRAFDHKSCV